MLYSEEQRRLLWLSQAEISADHARNLLAKRGSACALWEDFGRGIPISANAEANRVLTRFHSEAALDTLCERMEQKGVITLFAEDTAYPPLLRCIDDPSYVLYAMGDVAVLGQPSVAIVGTRYPSGYGRNMARTIAFGLCQGGVTVVSGMARGIDGCAHEGALDAGGKTVAVLGSGVNVPYPIENIGIYRKIIEGAGVVISEYPLDATAQAYHFPNRNRVISGLCHAVVFVEGKVKSGGMITVGTALNQGRDVFAVPGCVGQSGAEGPHTILREGARLVTSAADVLTDLGLQPEGDLTCEKRILPPQGDNLTQQAILKALMKEALGMDNLCARTGCTADELMTELSVMEIMGQVRRDSGNVFALAIRVTPTE
ncbi:MAG: DNA-processing protein DprA [Eubacteriales bacterium]|nr:DNA-processing protein DprA [Eubacteriales bacterium]